MSSSALLRVSIHPLQPLSAETKLHTTSQVCLAFFVNTQSVMSYQQMDTFQLFTPSYLHQYATSPLTTQQQEPPQLRAQAAAAIDFLYLFRTTAVKCSFRVTVSPSDISTSHLSSIHHQCNKNISCNQLSLSCSQLTSNNSSRTTALSPFQNQSVKFIGPTQDYPKPKQKHYTAPHQTHDPKTQETK